MLEVSVGRWEILRKTFEVSISKSNQVLIVYCKLQKFVTDETGFADIPTTKLSDFDGVTAEKYPQDDVKILFRCDSEEQYLRDAFSEVKYESGFQKPT